MQGSIYFSAFIGAVCGIWLVWDLGIRKFFLDGFRERLFELRFDLFRVAARGDVSFDNDAYRGLETLICGLLRFGHRVTFMGYLISLREQTRAKKANEFIDYHKQIELMVSRTEPAVQEKFRRVLTETGRVLFLYMVVSSLICLTTLPLLLILRAFNLLRNASKREISAVLESEIYRAESQRGRLLTA